MFGCGPSRPARPARPALRRVRARRVAVVVNLEAQARRGPQQRRLGAIVQHLPLALFFLCYLPRRPCHAWATRTSSSISPLSFFILPFSVSSTVSFNPTTCTAVAAHSKSLASPMFIEPDTLRPRLTFPSSRLLSPSISPSLHFRLAAPLPTRPTRSSRLRFLPAPPFRSPQQKLCIQPFSTGKRGPELAAGGNYVAQPSLSFEGWNLGLDVADNDSPIGVSASAPVEDQQQWAMRLLQQRRQQQQQMEMQARQHQQSIMMLQQMVQSQAARTEQALQVAQEMQARDRRTIMSLSSQRVAGYHRSGGLGETGRSLHAANAHAVAAARANAATGSAGGEYIPQNTAVGGISPFGRVGGATMAQLMASVGGRDALQNIVQGVVGVTTTQGGMSSIGGKGSMSMDGRGGSTVNLAFAAAVAAVDGDVRLKCNEDKEDDESDEGEWEIDYISTRSDE